MNKVKLIQLRQENCGYNPEKAEDIGNVEIMDNYTLFITDFSGDHVSVFTKDNTVKTEIEFIEKYPKTYGVIYKGEFYIQD